MTSISYLKLRLKLKFLQKEIDKEVKENFGYCPSSPYFDRLVEERNKLLSLCQETYPELWNQYT